MINAGKTKLNEDQAFAATFMVPHVEDEETEEAPASSGAAGEMNGVSDGAATEREHGTRSPDSISSSEWQMLVSSTLISFVFKVLGLAVPLKRQLASGLHVENSHLGNCEANRMDAITGPSRP